MWDDPAFAPAGYHLTAGSSAIGRGVNLGVVTDIDGNFRPTCGSYELGVDEYIPCANWPRVYLPVILKD